MVHCSRVRSLIRSLCIMLLIWFHGRYLGLYLLFETPESLRFPVPSMNYSCPCLFIHTFIYFSLHQQSGTILHFWLFLSQSISLDAVKFDPVFLRSGMCMHMCPSHNAANSTSHFPRCHVLVLTARYRRLTAGGDNQLLCHSTILTVL